jgi:hypothetical protein
MGNRLGPKCLKPDERSAAFYPLNYHEFNLEEAQSCSEIPACRGPEVLAILVEIDPIPGKKSEEYPHIYPKDYPERVEKFSGNYIWRKITGNITAEFLEALVDRMFTADEVTRVVELGKLRRLKHEIVSLFLQR